MDTPLNGDLSRRVAVDTAAMDWSASPSASVWRKRVHRVGPAEAGQVTSIVRYQPDSVFHAHEHPDGEEILVLDGVFSDEHGDWPAGTFLLNPQGFRHAPFSKDGCVLFVKLRQFGGRDRKHVVIDTHAMQWQAGPRPGIDSKLLYRQDGYADTVSIERWAAGAELGEIGHADGAELLVLEGAFDDDLGHYAAGCWLRLPAGSRHRPRTATGCTLHVKRGGLRYLQDARDG
jgi:anti-sigma factor ChrR (cupin superfamily)